MNLPVAKLPPISPVRKPTSPIECGPHQTRSALLQDVTTAGLNASCRGWEETAQIQTNNLSAWVLSCHTHSNRSKFAIILFHARIARKPSFLRPNGGGGPVMVLRHSCIGAEQFKWHHDTVKGEYHPSRRVLEADSLGHKTGRKSGSITPAASTRGCSSFGAHHWTLSSGLFTPRAGPMT